MIKIKETEQTRARLQSALETIKADLDKAAENIETTLNEDGASNSGFGGRLS
jgi:hypothetical protein